MPKVPLTALIGSGPVSQSWVARLPGLRENLGPVKSSSLRTASRLVNSIRAGRPVERYEDLRKTEMVLVAVPDEHLPALIDDLLGSGEMWTGCSVVVCSPRFSSASLVRLRQIGASTGSLDLMEGTNEKRYLFEGQNLALHRLRRLIEVEGTARVVEINEQMRSVYDAGITFAAGMTFPMVAAAVETLKVAGLRGKQAESVVEAAVLGALRSYLRAGRRGWSGPIARGDREELRKQYQALSKADQPLAEMYLKIALDYLVEMPGTGRKAPLPPG